MQSHKPLDFWKAKALAAALAQSKRFGKGTIMKLGGEVIGTSRWCHRLAGLDIALGVGGCRGSWSRFMALSRQARPLTLQVIAEMLAGELRLSTPSTRWTSSTPKAGREPETADQPARHRRAGAGDVDSLTRSGAI
jgi:hypothetical protein